MIQRTVERMYSETEENRFLEVTYANGDKEVLYFKDFNSGAMIENIVARAKKMAIKDLLEAGNRGIRVQHLLAACVDEFKENEDLPNTTNPDDWARDLRQEGRADRVHPHAGPGQAGHRGRALHRHRRQHRPVPLSRWSGARDRRRDGGGVGLTDKVRVKRVYEAATPDDGHRVLVDRIWPRGISKEHAHVDEWCKDVGPSTQRRTWFGHEPERFPEFADRYRAELVDSPALAHLAQVAREHARLTLVYSAKDRAAQPGGRAARRPSRRFRVNDKLSLVATAREHLKRAHDAASGRSADSIVGGHTKSLRQTVVALVAGRSLDEHESPGEATLQVLSGKVRLDAGSDSWEGSAGDLLVIPPVRHSVHALEDSAVLLTVVRPG